MTSPARKRDQSVEHQGARMPSGGDPGRTCDLVGCAEPSGTLVAAADGSVLLVCGGHGESLTSVAREPEATTEESAAACVKWPGLTRVFTGPRRALALGVVRALLGLGFMTWGLALLDRSGSISDQAWGVVLGTFGALAVLSTVRPRGR